ncbi:hypothetical protein AWENTII_002232 [Aspergillus wentii]
MTPHIDIQGNTAQPGSTQINNVSFTTSHTVDYINQLCLRALQCPDTLVVKNRLIESKDKLLYKSFEWILQDPHYVSWRDGDRVCLLWLKGGAGKGKTMISIGLVEQFLQLQNDSTVVTYFFCQNADYELNTLPAIIKGLILQLVNQQEELKETLRRHWDTAKNCFDKDITSWRVLWDIFMKMLNDCKCSRVYVIVDALDECQDDGMAGFLKLLVRTGLSHPSKVKWVLTSRPLDSAERELLVGSDQVQVSLELNMEHISEAVKAYIAFKVDELARRHRYQETLRQKIALQLLEKAEGTYLWVSLVCKRLESVHRDDALMIVQALPPGLHPFYHRIFEQLSEGEPADVKMCMRLLKVMMMAYRPLNVEEVGSVAGLDDDEEVAIRALIDRCASFIKMRDTTIEFTHQSARDYLAGKAGQSKLNLQERYGHDEIAMSCLSHLSERLVINLVGLPRPDSTREALDKKKNALLASVDYAASFWVQHLKSAKQTITVQNALAEPGAVFTFLHNKVLEWLECLSLLDKLPRAIEGLEALTSMAKDSPFLSILVQDTKRFLLRHYHMLTNWPLQTYSSAIIFSPETSVVRKENLGKTPTWLRKIPHMEDSWESLIQILAGHSGSVYALAFSPNGKQIASGSDDKTIKIWDAATGDLQRTITTYSDPAYAMAFSQDSKQIISGSYNGVIRLWDTITGNLQRTLPAGHLSRVNAFAFLPDSKHITSAGTFGQTFKIWDTAIGNQKKILAGCSNKVYAMAFSPDSEQIASSASADNGTIKLWDAATGDLQRTLAGHSYEVHAVAFSQDSKRIASAGAFDRTIKLWDTTTYSVQKKLADHSTWIYSIAFSADGKQIASGSSDGTIKLWDATAETIQKTPASQSDWANTVAISPDGKQIASGFVDGTIKLWDTATDNLQKTLDGHSDSVHTVAFSPDGKQIISRSKKTIKLWETITGNLQKILDDHVDCINTVAFSADGKQIASGSDDRTIKLWDAATDHIWV